MVKTSRMLPLVMIGLVLIGQHSAAAGQAALDLPWSQVKLAGMDLSLLSPARTDHSADLRFSERYVALEICDHHYCTDPLSVWKIEGNRLKIGYAPDEGYALIGVSDSKLVLRDKDGTAYSYAIVHP